MTTNASPVQTSPAYVESIADCYDRLLGPFMFDPYACELAARLELGSGARLLELACGTGIATRRFLLALPHVGQIVATDVSAPMLAVARATLPSDPRLTLHAADAHDLPYPPSNFDAVACQFGFMLFPDKQLALQQSRRVLRPGGLLSFNVWGALSDNPGALLAHRTIARFVGPPFNFFEIVHGWNDADAIRRLVEQAGFTSVRVERVERVGVSATADDLARGIVSGTPIAVALAQGGVADVEQVQAVLAEALATAFGRAPCRALQTALFVSARAVVDASEIAGS